MSDDDIARLGNYSALLEDDDDDEGGDDTFGEVGLDKYQQKVIKNVAEPYITKIMKRTGKNFARVGLEFLTRGPGLTNFNFFDGVLDLVKESLSTDFVDRIGEIYDKDFRFRKAYSYIMNQWKKRDTNVDKKLIDIAENYDVANNDEKTLLRNTLNMVAILLSGKYKNLITRELNSFYSNTAVPKLLVELADRLNTEVDPSGDVTAQAARILRDFARDHKILESNLRPISNLYFMVSSAISLSTFRAGYWKNNKNLRVDYDLAEDLLDAYKDNKYKYHIDSINTELLEKLDRYIIVTSSSDDTKNISTTVNEIKINFKAIINYLNSGNKNNVDKIVRSEREIRKKLKQINEDLLYIKGEDLSILNKIKELADSDKNILNIYLNRKTGNARR